MKSPPSKKLCYHDNSSTQRIFCWCPDLLALKVSNAFPLVRRALVTFVAADLDANTSISAASGPTITKRGQQDFRLEGSKRGASKKNWKKRKAIAYPTNA